MSNTLLLGLTVAGGYYYYTNQDAINAMLQGQAQPQAQPQPQEQTDGVLTNGGCEEGYTLSADGTECSPFDDGSNPCDEGFQLSKDGLSCEASNPCDEGYKLSSDGLSCVTTDPTGGCGEGFVLSTDGKDCLSTTNPCGDKCFTYENNNCVMKDPNCGSVTGSAIGDSFLYMGESVVAGEIYDFIGRKVGKVAERIAEKELAKKTAKELADKTAQETAKKTAERFEKAMAKKSAQEVEEAMAKRASREATKKFLLKKASQEVGEALSKRAGKIVAKQSAKQLLVIAGRKMATKIAVLVAKINAQNSTGIGVIMSALSVIALGLTIGLSAGGIVFDKNDPSDWDWDNLPEGARIALEALPLFGDIISIVSPFVAFTTKCQPGTQEENLLCYEPPKPDWTCEAFLCHASGSAYGGFDSLSETSTHLTKKILMDTGTIPDTAPPGMTKEGAFAYQVTPGRHLVGGTEWGDCENGQVDDGALCRVPIVLDPCPPNTIDDGLLCRVPITLGSCNGDEVDDGLFCRVPLRGGEVHTVCEPIGCHSLDDCVWGRGCGCWGGGCNTWSDPITGGQSRAKPSWGGEVYPKGSRGGEVYPKASQVLTPHSLECDSSKENISGLCYRRDLPQGYTRKTLGLLDQNCPDDKPEWSSYANFRHTEDIGVSCQKASMTRPPFAKFAIYGKRKHEEPPEEPDPPLPALCKTLIPDKDDGVLCRLTECGDGYDMSADGVSCVKRCNADYTFNFANKMCEKINADGTTDAYDNSAGVIDIIYDYFVSKCETGQTLKDNVCFDNEPEPGVVT